MESRKQVPHKATIVKLRFEDILSAATEKLDANLGMAACRPAVPGLIFPQYPSDSRVIYRRNVIVAQCPRANPADRDDFRAENILREARKAPWSDLQSNARQSAIGNFIDDAVGFMAPRNYSFKGILPEECAPPANRVARLGELINLSGARGRGDNIVTGSASPLLTGGGP
jgi:type I restriction enzyme M protein